MINYIGKEVEVIIDRPLGSKHPEYNLIYSLNYGYIPNTVSGDGEEIDAYILGEFEPIKKYRGTVIAVINRKDDNEDKLVVARKLNSYDKNQIRALTEFTERFYESEIITYDYLKQSIRNTVRAIARRNKEILVIQEVEDNEIYYHLPGGGIEFREKIIEALKREVKEELEVEVINYNHIITIDNLFEVDGMKAHEIAHVYEVDLSKDIYHIDEKAMLADVIPSKIMWIEVDEFKSNKKVFYPKELVRLL